VLNKQPQASGKKKRAGSSVVEGERKEIDDIKHLHREVVAKVGRARQSVQSPKGGIQVALAKDTTTAASGICNKRVCRLEAIAGDGCDNQRIRVITRGRVYAHKIRRLLGHVSGE